MAELPSGTVTMLFTDIEGSTRLLQDVGRDAYVRALQAHRRILREVVGAHGGVEIEMQGDSFHFAFASAWAGVLAAAEAQRALHTAGEHNPIRVRIGLHTGEPVASDGLYAGLDVHRASRVMSAGHGGQVVASAATQAAANADLPSGLAFADLGMHRLKDLAEPQRLYQLLVVGLPNEFPPLRTRSPNTRLPIPSNRLVGRAVELREIAELVVDGDARLLTLVGAGGSGKTRLAVHAAARIADSFPDGVWFVPLAPLRDPNLVLPLVLRTLGHREEAGRAIPDTLTDQLTDKALLLLLDNVEHVAAAAADLPLVLAGCPDVRILATSREPLHLSGEHVYEVPPLPMDEAVALFADRAHAVSRDFELDGENAQTVARICARLDGLPLAVELAAARSAALSPTALLARLDRRLGLLEGGPRDAEERQRTLRSTIEWSHELLDPEERRAFRRLAVFAGGGRLDAVEATLGSDDPLGRVSGLVEKSLVRRDDDPDGEPRYWMLETIREYASEQLAGERDAEDVRRRHAEHFVGLAARAEPFLRGDDEAIWLDRLEREHDNFRATLAFALESKDVETAFSLPLVLNRLWMVRGHLTEGMRWMEEVLEVPAPPAQRPPVLRKLAIFALEQGLLDRASAAAEEALALDREAGDVHGAAHSAGVVADVAAHRGDLDTAGVMYTEAADQARAFGDDIELALSLYNLGHVRRLQREGEAAEPLFEEALEVFGRLGDAVGQGGVALALAGLAAQRHNFDRALDFLSTSVEQLRRVSYVGGLVDVIDVAADVAAKVGDPARAARLWGAQHARAQEIGRVDRHPAEAAAHDESIGAARDALGSEVFQAAWTEGEALTLDEAIDYVFEVTRLPERQQTI